MLGESILSLAHSIPMAGHLGKEKTRKRIMQHFYWLTLYEDVEHFCRCCRQCQKSSNKGVPKAPLVPLPIIVFEKTAMDIVGPLPWSRSILVIKTHDSESQGQEEAGRTQRTSELFTRSIALKFVNALNKPP